MPTDNTETTNAKTKEAFAIATHQLCLYLSRILFGQSIENDDGTATIWEGGVVYWKRHGQQWDDLTDNQKKRYYDLAENVIRKALSICDKEAVMGVIEEVACGGALRDREA